MRRSTGKNTIVLLAVGCAGIIVVAVMAGLLHNWLTRPAPVTISDSLLVESYTKKYPPTVTIPSVSIEKYITYAQQWVIADLAFATNHSAEETTHEDEADHEHVVTGTRCVYAIKAGAIEVLACSSEGFYASDFSDTTPDSLIERANQPL